MLNGIKVLPELYNYTRLTGIKSFSRRTFLPKGVQLSFDAESMQKLKFSQDEIKKAYQIYAQCPFINAYLREGGAISESSNKIAACLKQGVSESSGVTGKFVRGITGNRRIDVNDTTIAKLIFENKGFTSTAPKDEARFAETFALGKNSAVVEFDIKTPMKAYQANRYETIFDTNAFTADKFGVEKIKENYYRVFEKG